MIRNIRTYVALQAVGASASLLLLILWWTSPPVQPLLPGWLFVGVALFLAGSFAFNIVTTLRTRSIPHAAWARKLGNSRMWAIKGVVLAALGAAAAIIVFRR